MIGLEKRVISRCSKPFSVMIPNKVLPEVAPKSTAKKFIVLVLVLNYIAKIMQIVPFTLMFFDQRLIRFVQRAGILYRLMFFDHERLNKCPNKNSLTKKILILQNKTLNYYNLINLICTRICLNLSNT